MLQYPEFPRSVNLTNPPARTITGRRLARLIQQASPRDRALIANDLARGVMQILRPTYVQAAALAHVSASYVATSAGLRRRSASSLRAAFFHCPACITAGAPMPSLTASSGIMASRRFGARSIARPRPAATTARSTE